MMSFGHQHVVDKKCASNIGFILSSQGINHIQISSSLWHLCPLFCQISHYHYQVLNLVHTQIEAAMFQFFSSLLSRMVLIPTHQQNQENYETFFFCAYDQTIELCDCWKSPHTFFFSDISLFINSLSHEVLFIMSSWIKWRTKHS
jgi:hypothetical protein